MEEFIFDVPGKGQTLHAFLLISMGEREKGMAILKQFIAHTETSLRGQQRMQNLKMRKQLKQAQEVFNVVQLNKAQFFNNVRMKHEHTARVTNLQFSENSQFMTTTCKESCKVWKVITNLLGTIITIPAALDAEHKEESVAPLACVNN